jgi:DNA polymerase III subunit alpha
VEKKEQETRLSCRWLDDLCRADEAMIEACDQAFDKAKQMSARAANMREAPAKKTVKEEKSMKTVCIKIDAEKVRISHLMEIKKLFTTHAGKTSVKLEFHASDQPVGKVHIDEKWGIELTHEFKEKLQQLSTILSLEA